MFQPIFQTDKILISFDQEKKVCEIALSHDFDEIELFKADLKKFLEIAAKHKAEKALWNLENFNITIGPELQAWIDDNINKAEVEMGISKEAFLVQDDLTAELSVEQTMDEAHAQGLQTKLFNNRNEAIDWLLT